MNQPAIIRGVLLAALATPLLSAVPAGAAGVPSPSLLIVHGIAGADLGVGYLPTLPIDISIDGTCVKPGAEFGSAQGPFPVATGAHTLKISLANTAAPCTGTAVITQPVTLAAGEQAALVAAESTAGQPAAEMFDLTEATPVTLGTARVVLFHTANAPAIDVTLTALVAKKVATFPNLKPGARIAGTILPFTAFEARVMPTGSKTVAAGPLGFSASNRSVEALFVVGSAATGSVTVIRKEIAAVF
jgi:hypothetical protein